MFLKKDKLNELEKIKIEDLDFINVEKHLIFSYIYNQINYQSILIVKIFSILIIFFISLANEYLIFISQKAFPDLKKYSKKIIPHSFNIPLVSIIIPVHNNFNYTYNCICSILDSNIQVHYEIIIANDMSSDETKIIRRYFKNIRVINNNKQLNYLLNCNKASKYAKGKYLVFQNNDTRVQKNWLTYLLKLIENDETIGLVGPKFLDNQGKIKEAGGMTFPKGNTYPYGYQDNQNKPEYNYVKEVDYISGASILIKKSIWEKIGGYDESYAPAYYEDTDLAYKLRNEGYKVVYQPKSVVQHFGRISTTQYLNHMKETYKSNLKRFSQKWKKELENQGQGKNFFIRRDRGYKKNRIFIIYPFILDLNKKKEKNLIDNLFFFRKIGFQVTFFTENLEGNEHFTIFLQQKGIEVLYGEWYKKKIKKWLNNYIKYFNYIYILDNHIGKEYIDIFKNNFSGKIFFRIDS